MDQVKIGRFIAELRKEKGMTQRELANDIGVSDKTISKWECGSGMPEMSSLMPLCQALQINVNELLAGERLSHDNYSQKAEENIMNLIQENRKQRKKGTTAGCTVASWIDTRHSVFGCQLWLHIVSGLLLQQRNLLSA